MRSWQQYNIDKLCEYNFFRKDIYIYIYIKFSRIPAKSQGSNQERKAASQNLRSERGQKPTAGEKGFAKYRFEKTFDAETVQHASMYLLFAYKNEAIRQFDYVLITLSR